MTFWFKSWGDMWLEVDESFKIGWSTKKLRKTAFEKPANLSSCHRH